MRWAANKKIANPLDTNTGSGMNLKLTDLITYKRNNILGTPDWTFKIERIKYILTPKLKGITNSILQSQDPNLHEWVEVSSHEDN